jgi:hypothetical protein
MAGSTDYAALADHYADPNVPVDDGGPVEHWQEPRPFLEREFGSLEAAESFIHRGRPRLGESRTQGRSKSVRGRLSDTDFAAFENLMAKTGRTQSQLVREGVRLLIEAEAS